MLTANSTTDFRFDVNGLRAWAIVSVILYHFGVPSFQGGFLGVDIFFVISGFLITGIIIEGLTLGKFSLQQFYLARAKRIIPALFVFCLAMLIVGWFALASPDYLELGQEATYALTFVSNILFWNQSGYFDATAHEKWLLHTWSLSVEWQFYMLYPVILMLTWKIQAKLKALILIILIGWAISFLLSLWFSIKNPTPAFYLLPTRAWELLSGGLSYLFTKHKQIKGTTSRSLEICGFCLIISSILLFDERSSWPGWRALLPVSGAAIILIAARPHSILTNNPIAQWLGDCSYSLYLWHWFIVVISAYFELPRDILTIPIGIAITTMLAWTSYKWVEQPARIRLGQIQQQTAFASICLTCSILIAFSTLTWKKQGWPQRFSENTQVELAANAASPQNPRDAECLLLSGTESPSCVFGGNRIKAVLVGDSHASALATAITAALPDKNDGLLEWAYLCCPTIFGIHRKSDTAPKDHDCFGFNSWIKNKINEIPKDIPLIIINRAADNATYNTSTMYFENSNFQSTADFIKLFSKHLTETACEFAKNRTVYMVRPVPDMPSNVPKKLSRRAIWGINIGDLYIPKEGYLQKTAYIWEAQNAARDQCGIKILDPLPYLCKDDRCYGSKDGIPLYMDDNHINEYGGKLLVPMFSEVFNNVNKSSEKNSFSDKEKYVSANIK